jgi:hypothetical protein
MPVVKQICLFDVSAPEKGTPEWVEAVEKTAMISLLLGHEGVAGERLRALGTEEELRPVVAALVDEIREEHQD